MRRTHTETIEHVIGELGQLHLKLVSGSVRVRGIEGPDAHVRVRVELRDGEDAADVVDVSRLEGELRIDVGGRRRGLAGLFSASVPEADIEAEMPRGGSLRLSGISADLEARDISGDQAYRTVSGDLSIESVSGRLSLQSVSGDVRVEGGRLSIDGTTTSGDIEIRAERAEQLRLRSVSGDVDIAASFDAGPEHRIESVSGDLRIEPANGVSIAVSGFSSTIHSELPYREEARGSKRVLVVGDGSADVTFRTMSGDAEICAPPGVPTERQAPIPAYSVRERVIAERDAAREAAREVHDAARAARDATRAERDGIRDAVRAARELAREQVRELTRSAKQRASGETRHQREAPHPDGARGPGRQRAGPDRGADPMDILRALERGEIDVDEASRLLEGTDHA